MNGSLMPIFLQSMAAWSALTFFSYLIIAGGGYYFIWMRGKERWQHKRILPERRRPPQPWNEFKLSTVLCLMFGAMLGGITVLTALGWTRMYANIGDFGWTYFLGSIVLMAVLHDSYYYWAHRLMHSKLVFRHIHLVHHRFTNPTPFACYAFHPFEGVVEIAIIGLLLLLMPIHSLALAIYIVIQTVLNVISHLGYEFYPAWISRWFITSTHHSLHHAHFHGHYMLYFNAWDRLMGTNQADYHDICESLAAAKPPEYRAS